MISTRDLAKLPDVDVLRRLLQSLAMLDAVMSPEWEYRYYSFNARWSRGEMMGSMRDGEGDDFFALFNAAGCFLKGFAHESPMSPYRERPVAVWPGVLDGVPAAFQACLTEPAFNIPDTTFCVWRGVGDPSWQKGAVKYPPRHPDPDGSDALLAILDGRPQSYRRWASDYYEHDIPLSAVKHVYAQEPLTPEVISALNPDRKPAGLAADIREIGYPEAERTTRKGRGRPAP